MTENTWKEVEEQRDEINYVKWEKEGTEVIGVLKELFEGKEKSKFAKLDTGAPLKTMVSVPSILFGKIEAHIGKEIKIVYLGTVKFKSGRTGKDFKVYVKEEAKKPASSIPPEMI